MRKKIIILTSSIFVFLLLLWGVGAHNYFIVLLDGKSALIAESLRNHFMDNLMVFATNTCGTIGAPIIFILFSYFLFLNNKIKYLFVFAGSLILSGIAEITIKQLVGRARPMKYLITESGFSFPSGHSTAATVFLISSVVLIVPLIKNKLSKTLLLALVWILFPLVALSRIYLSVHYASDVLGSIFLGITCFVAIQIIADKPLPEDEKNAINTK